MLKSFKVHGKVQGVMFRKTFIKGLIKRNLKGGATNINDFHRSVDITIEADNESQIFEVVQELLRLKVINSWNATVEKIDEIKIIEVSNHEVTTDNIDTKKWSSGVDFYF